MTSTQIENPSGVLVGDAPSPLIVATADASLDINLVASAESAELTLGQGQCSIFVEVGDFGDTFTNGDEIVFEKSPDGVHWDPLYLYARAGGSPSGGQYAFPPSWQFVGPVTQQILVGNVAGCAAVRVRAILIQTGDNVNVHMRVSTAMSEVMQVAIISQPSAAGSTQVQGVDANGNVPTGKPVLVAGWDGSNVRQLLTDLFGTLLVVASGASSTGQLAGSSPFLMGGTTGGINGQVTNIKTDASGNLLVTVNPGATIAIAGTPAVTLSGNPSVSVNGTVTVTPKATSYHHMSSAGTVVLKSGPGRLATVCVNTLGNTNATVTLYDNTSGSGGVIAVIDCHTSLRTNEYSLAFSTGLTAVMTGSPDVTITYE